jgi:hypothetical protein
MMPMSYSATVTAKLLIAACLAVAASVQAQQVSFYPGLLAVPDEDFTWLWGNFDRAGAGFGAQVALSGRDQGFECVMAARLVGPDRLTDTERRQIERDVESGTSFIRSAVDTLNFLSQRRDLDWGRLACERLGQAESDRQRDAMIEQRLRRRERPPR